MAISTNVTVAGYAHHIARLANVDAACLDGLDRLDLDVLYFGIVADGAPSSFVDRISRLATPALELHRDNPAACPTAAHRAACDLVLACRANAARRANH